MAVSPGGVEEGRVSIRVVPDTSKFAADLRGDLKKIAAEINFAIKVDLDNSGLDEKARAAADEAQAAAGTISIKTSVDQKSLRAVTRDLTSFGKSVKSELSSVLHGATFAALGLSAAGSVPGVLSLAGSLTSLLGVAALFPGVLASMGIAFAVLKLGAAGFSKELQALQPQIQQLKKIVNAGLFDQFDAAVKLTVSELMPQLKTGLAQVSSAMGGFLDTFVGALGDFAKFNFVSVTLAEVAKAFVNLAPAIQPFVDALGTLITIGSSFLPGFSTAISNASIAFNKFIQNAAGAGQISAFIRDALDGFGQLFSVLKSVADVLGGVIRAAQAAGGGTLQTFAKLLQQVADVVNSNDFQAGLTGVFAGIQGAAKALGGTLPAIGQALITLAPAIADFAAVLGTVLAAAIQAVVPAIIALAPALDQLILAIGPALVQAISALTPALTSLATALAANPALFAAATVAILAFVSPVAAAAVAIGFLIANFSTLKTFFTNNVVPVFQAVAAALQPTITAFESVATAAATLFAVLAPIVTAIVAIFVQNWPQIQQVVGQVFSTIQTIIVNALTILRTEFLVWAAVINFLWQHFGSIILSTISTVFPAILTIISGVLNIIQGLFQLFTDLLKGNWSGAWADIKQIVSGAIQVLQGTVREGLGLLKGLAQVAITAFVDVFKSLGSKIIGAVGDLSGVLVQAGEDVISGLIKGIENATVGPLKTALGGVTDFIKKHKGPPSVDKVLLVPAGQQIIGGLIAGMESQLPAVKKSLSLVTAAVSAPNGVGASSGGPSVVYEHVEVTDLQELMRLQSQNSRDAATVANLQALLVG